MKLQYSEYRPAVGRTEVEAVAEIVEPKDFRDAILAEIKICLDNNAEKVAHALLDWHKDVVDNENIKPGAKLVYNYGGGKDPVGTWEIVE